MPKGLGYGKKMVAKKTGGKKALKKPSAAMRSMMRGGRK